MAILKSLIFDGSKGSIGNVTLAVLKGQTIAKQKIANPTPSATIGQVESRGRMSNAVMAWQFLSIFLLYFVSAAKTTESVYNSFIRLTKNIFSDVVAGSASLAASMLANTSIGMGSLVSSIVLNSDGGDLVAVFTTGGSIKPVDLHIRAIHFNQSTGSNEILSRLVTDGEWSDGIITLSSFAPNDDSLCVYFYSVADKKNSGFVFSA